MRSGTPARLRGRLATRLLAVFALASVLPVLLTSLLAYRELVHAVEARQSRAVRDEAKDSALTLLSQLQVASAELVAAGAAGQHNGNPPPHAADTPDEFSSISIERLGTAAEPAGVLAEVPSTARSALESGKPILYWRRIPGVAPQLRLARPLSAQRVAVGVLDLPRLLERARPPNASSGIALVDTTDESILFHPDRVVVPLTTFRALQAATAAGMTTAGAASAAGATSALWRDSTGAWRGAHWDLFLEDAFASAPLRILVCESAANAAAELRDLRLIIPLSLLGAMLFSVLLAVMQLRRYLGPLDTLTAATRRLGARDFDVEVKIDTHDELAVLGEDFNRMARALRHRVATLEAVSEVDRLLLASPSLEAVLDALLPCIAQVLQCSQVSVMLVDPDSSRHARLYEHEPGAAMPIALRRVELDPRALVEVAGAPAADADAAQPLRGRVAARELFATVCEPASRAMASHRIWPLTLDNRLAGALFLGWNSRPEAREADDDAARGFADRLRVALINLSHRDELLRRANFDGLTGLANRNFFRTTLNERIAHCTRTGVSSALLYVDLDDFKKVNDSAGHEAGDALLVEVAGRLRACCGAGDVIARLGGDEFAVVPAAEADASEAARAARRILDALSTPVSVAGASRRVSASIGVALIPEHGEDVALLLRNADIAMYRAKEQGRNRMTLFARELHDRMASRIALESALQDSVAAGDLSLNYQPIVSGGHPAGVEALVRWSHPSVGEVSPAVFIPIAEQSGLILAIGQWVLHRACEDFARWRAAGIAPAYVSINVAPKQLESGGLVEELKRLMGMHGLLPAQVQLEITESAMAEGPAAVDSLVRIAKLGVRLALDDFGTGYSSLGHLHRLPFDVVKIDRSFITELPGSAVAQQLVRTILSMARGLGKLVVAEGVETEAQRDCLSSLGCDAMQGYLFSRPLAEEAIRAWLVTRASAPD